MSIKGYILVIIASFVYVAFACDAFSDEKHKIECPFIPGLVILNMVEDGSPAIIRNDDDEEPPEENIIAVYHDKKIYKELRRKFSVWTNLYQSYRKIEPVPGGTGIYVTCVSPYVFPPAGHNVYPPHEEVEIFIPKDVTHCIQDKLDKKIQMGGKAKFWCD